MSKTAIRVGAGSPKSRSQIEQSDKPAPPPPNFTSTFYPIN
ncbi:MULTISPECIES: hypothetical protein [unclassified Microcoleus]|nr:MULTISPECIES: hypothetical protein [unclassified Microcoleus]